MTKSWRAIRTGSASVDAIVFFNQDTQLPQMESFRFRVSTKTAGYLAEELVGGCSIEAWSEQAAPIGINTLRLE